MAVPLIASALDTIYFTIVNGFVQHARTAITEIGRPGDEGHAFRQDPVKAQPFSLTCMLCSTAASSVANRERVLNLQGQPVTYADPLGQSYVDLIVLSVRVLADQDVLQSTGAIGPTTGAPFDPGVATTMLTFEIILQKRR